MPDQRKNQLDILDDIYFEAALVESESAKPRTAEQRRWSRDVVESFRGRIAELRRSRLPANVTPVKARPIRTSLLAMTRDALLAKLAELTQGGQIQYAHRNLKGLSDDDLRRMIDLLDPPASDSGE
jgi:hypothetical protein